MHELKGKWTCGGVKRVRAHHQLWLQLPNHHAGTFPLCTHSVYRCPVHCNVDNLMPVKEYIRTCHLPPNDICLMLLHVVLCCMPCAIQSCWSDVDIYICWVWFSTFPLCTSVYRCPVNCKVDNLMPVKQYTRRCCLLPNDVCLMLLHVGIFRMPCRERCHHIIDMPDLIVAP